MILRIRVIRVLLIHPLIYFFFRSLQSSHHWRARGGVTIAVIDNCEPE